MINNVVELDRKHAYWEKLDNKYRCSFCGNMSITDSMYCSVCGSVMDLDMEIANMISVQYRKQYLSKETILYILMNMKNSGFKDIDYFWSFIKDKEFNKD